MSSSCPECKKSVYPMDSSINLDGKIFHSKCAKCKDCSCQITLSNFTLSDSADGPLLLCKTHYFTRFNSGEGYAGGEKFQGKTKEPTGKLSGSPLTTIKSSTKCKICDKSLYPVDPQLNVDGTLFHKVCAKCADCNCQITLSNFAAVNSPDEYILLCKTHYSKRFSESGGSYPGGEKYNVKNSRDMKAAEVTSASRDPVRNENESTEKAFDFASKTSRGSLTKTNSGITEATVSGDSEDSAPVSVEE
jgi:hypothetical protein